LFRFFPVLFRSFPVLFRSDAGKIRRISNHGRNDPVIVMIVSGRWARGPPG
jgi:hypothetical protein